MKRSESPLLINGVFRRAGAGGHRLMAALRSDGRRSLATLVQDCQGFSFDTALSASAAARLSPLAFAKSGHVLIGSDWPHPPATAVSYSPGRLDAYAALEDASHAAIDRSHAPALLPTL